MPITYPDDKLSNFQSVSIDWTRGIAAQLVLIGHAVGGPWIGGSEILIQELGVVLFFMVSGFLIAYSVSTKPNTYGFLDYLIDRGSRIFTPYVPCIAFIVLAGLVFGLDGPLDFPTILANLFMLQDFPLHRAIRSLPQVERVGTGRQLWTVALEWWIYMAFAGIVFFRRMPLWGWPIVSIGMIVVFFNAAGGMLAIIWGLGAIASVVLFRMNMAPWPAILFVSALAAGTRGMLVSYNFYDFQLQVLIGATAFAALKFVQDWTVPNWFAQLGASLAAISYTLYLTHYTITKIWPGWISIIIANLVAVAMWWCFERHYRAVATYLKTALCRRKLAPGKQAG